VQFIKRCQTLSGSPRNKRTAADKTQHIFLSRTFQLIARATFLKEPHLRRRGAWVGFTPGWLEITKNNST